MVTGPFCRRAVDQSVFEARQRLRSAVRDAHRAGMTQQQIAAAIGRSQPEVSRRLNCHGSSPLAKRTMASRKEVIALVWQAVGRNVRVFGSLATGKATETSDVDLVFDMAVPVSLFELADLEHKGSDLIRASVDLPEQSLRRGIRERVLAEAVPL